MDEESSVTDEPVRYIGVSPTCILHGQQLVEIKVILKELKDKIADQSGRVGKVEDSVDSIRTWQASIEGASESTSKLIREWAIVIGLGLTLWQVYSTDRKVQSLPQTQGTQQQQQAK